jgi:hypothetical protein
MSLLSHVSYRNNQEKNIKNQSVDRYLSQTVRVLQGNLRHAEKQSNEGATRDFGTDMELRLQATNNIYSESHQWQELRVKSKAGIHSLSSRKRERRYQRQTCKLKAKESEFIPSPFSIPLLKKA